MQNLIRTFVLLISLLSLSCLDTGITSTYDDESSETLEDSSVPNGSIRFRGEFSRPAAISSSASVMPNQVLLIELGSQAPPVIVDVNVGEFSTIVPKGQIYLGAAIYNPSISALARPMTVGSAISFLGNIGIVSLGLDSIPVSNDSSDELILGELVDTGSVFTSDIGDAAASDVLGYSIATLEDFGTSDQQALRALNPDINQNGIYDTNEGIRWLINFFAGYHITSDLYDISTDFVSIPITVFTESIYNFILDLSGLPLIENDISLVLPTDRTFTDATGNPITEITLRYIRTITDSGLWQDSDGIVNYQEAFPFGATPYLPATGDYVVDFGAYELRFENLVFASPDTGYEGFIFPLMDVTYDNAGAVSLVEWKWYLIRDGEYVAASAELVELSMSGIYFGDGQIFPTAAEYWGVSYYDNGTVDMSSVGYTVFSTAPDQPTFGCGYSTKSGLMYASTFYLPNNPSER